MQSRDLFARTYSDAKKNIDDGFVSLGVGKRQGWFGTVSFEHPIIKILNEYRVYKAIYAYQHKLIRTAEKKMSQEKLDDHKYEMDCLHAIIQDAIANTSSAELLSINQKGYILWGNRDVSSSFILSLCQIGAVDLFDALLEKISHELSIKDFVKIYKALHEAYQGDLTSERFGLGCSFLKRGDACFVEMARSVFLRLIAENKLERFFDKLFKPEFRYNDSHKITINEAQAFHQKEFVKEWTHDKFIKKSVKFGHSKYGGSDTDESYYEEIFDRFVSRHDYKDLFAQLTMDYFMPYLIKNGQYQFIQPKDDQGNHCVRSLLSQSSQVLFEQNKNDHRCVVYDSLDQNLLLFKRKPDAVALENIVLSEDEGQVITAEIKSLEFTLSKKSKY